MKISDVLRSKGKGVITVRPDETVSGLLALLAEHRIGACVVSSDGSRVDGIVSERDVVRHLHSTGTAVLGGPVSAIMTGEVTTGAAGLWDLNRNSILDVMETWPETRLTTVLPSPVRS